MYARLKGLSEEEARRCSLLRNEIEHLIHNGQQEGKSESGCSEESEESSASLGSRSDISCAAQNYKRHVEERTQKRIARVV